MTFFQLPPSSRSAVGIPRTITKPRWPYLLVILLIALGYGWGLATFPSDAFLDRTNYLIYADHSFSFFLGYWSQGVLPCLTNEPAWLLLNAALQLALEPESTIQVIIGIPATIVAFLVLRSDPKNFIWLLIFLFLPQVIKNHIVHLRQGLGISIFLLGYYSNWRRPLCWFLLLLTPFIHASFFFVLPLFFLAWFVRKLRLGASLRNFMFCGTGLVVSVSLGVLAQILGARQASQYEFNATQISGLGFGFWSLILILLISQGRTWIRQQTFALGVLVFYLSTYFFIEVAARVFESSMIILLLAGVQMNGWRRYTFIAMMLGYGLLGYALKLDQHWLGFGLT
jgi:hypothetical protein